MGTTVAIVAILLALIAAGCIAFIAWEITSEETIGPPDAEDARDEEH